MCSSHTVTPGSHWPELRRASHSAVPQHGTPSHQTDGERQSLSASALTVCLFIISDLLLFASPAFSQSTYVDFDGGGGSWYSSSTPPRVSTGSDSYSSGRGSRNDYSSVDYSGYEKRLREQQLKEEQRKKELEEKIRQAKNLLDAQKALQLLKQLHQLQGIADNDFEQAHQRSRVINNLVPRLGREQREANQHHESRLERLAHDMDHIQVPSPSRCYGKQHPQILILGTFDTPQEAEKDWNNHLKNPFTGGSFCDIFGFGRESLTAESARVFFEHFLQNTNILSATTVDQLARLKGATIEEVVCHSNGCAVAEAVIRAGFVKGVKRLRILGGDAAVTNLDSIKKLQEQMIQRVPGARVDVYAVIGDPVPLIPTGWQILDAMRRIGEPLTSFESARSLTYEALGLKGRRGFDAASRLQVQFLTPPVKGAPSLKLHEFLTYAGIIWGQTVNGFRTSTGDIKPEAIIR